MLDDQPFPRTVTALRLLNVVLCSVVVWATWAIARELWPTRPRLALVAAGCTAVCGPLAAAAASVNNDGLMLPLMAVALALMAGILRRGVTVRAAAVLGATVGLGLLVKGELLVIAAVGLAAVLLAPVADARVRLRAAVAYLAIGGIGGLWWLRVFVDDRAITPSGGELLAPPRTGPWNDENPVSYVWGRLDTVIDWFPGRYGSYPWPFKLLPSGLLLACQLGVVVLLVAWLVARRWTRPTIASLRVALLAAVPFLLFAASAYTAWDTYRSNGYHHGLAPRYVYGGVPVMAVMAAASLGAVAARLRLRGVPQLHALLLVGLGHPRHGRLAGGVPARDVLHDRLDHAVPAGRDHGAGRPHQGGAGPAGGALDGGDRRGGLAGVAPPRPAHGTAGEHDPAPRDNLARTMGPVRGAV